MRMIHWRHRIIWFVASCFVLLVSCDRGQPEPVDVGAINSDVESVVVQPAPVSANSATLGWDDVPIPNIRGYRIYYGPDPDMYLQLPGQGIDVGRVRTYTITGLTSGRRYYFAVTTVDRSGNESEFSNQVFKDIP